MLARLLLLTVVGLAGTDVAWAADFRSEDGHFSFTIPADWEPLTTEQLEQVSRLAQSFTGNKSAKILLGIRPQPSPAEHFPFLLVAQTPTPQQSLSYDDFEAGLQAAAQQALQRMQTKTGSRGDPSAGHGTSQT